MLYGIEIGKYMMRCKVFCSRRIRAVMRYIKDNGILLVAVLITILIVNGFNLQFTHTGSLANSSKRYSHNHRATLATPDMLLSRLSQEDDNIREKPDYTLRENRESWEEFIDMGKYTDHRYYPVYELDLFFYSAFFDDRVIPNRIRFLGLQGRNFSGDIYCIYNGVQRSTKVKVDFVKAIFPEWPCNKKCPHTAYFYSCPIPYNTGLDITRFTININDKVNITLPILNGDGLEGKNKKIGLCLKSVEGDLNATRLVEWIEFNKLIGIDKIIVYYTNVTAKARKVFEDYAGRGVVELIEDPYPMLVRRDTNSWATGDTHKLDYYWLIQQGYLVAYNDCLYRFRKNFKYLLVIDYDEILVPNHPRKLYSLIDELYHYYNETSGFTFKSAQHLTYFGAIDNGQPSYLHTMRYLRRTEVLYNQPKSVINPDTAMIINWHTVVDSIESRQSSTFSENVLVSDWKNIGFVHHFRYRCRSNNWKECRNKRIGMAVDDVMPRYQKMLHNNVKRALDRLNMIQ